MINLEYILGYGQKPAEISVLRRDGKILVLNETQFKEIIVDSQTSRSKCSCHCHSGHNLPDGVQCRCIKNCIHCHPENFPQPAQAEQRDWEKTFDDTFYFPHYGECATQYAMELDCDCPRDKELQNIKSFIRQVAAEAAERERNKTIDDVRNIIALTVIDYKMNEMSDTDRALVGKNVTALYAKIMSQLTHHDK